MFYDLFQGEGLITCNEMFDPYFWRIFGPVCLCKFECIIVDNLYFYISNIFITQ